jgi:quercetin dioxygenase-like cupin family protein
MTKLARHFAAIAAAGVTATSFMAHVSAQEVYTPKAAKTGLVKEALAGVDGKQITIDRYSLPPEYVGGKHYHTGPVYVYVISGSFSVEEAGKPAQVFSAGQLYKEPIGTPMQAKNVSNSGAVDILVIQVGKEGEPLMYRAE